MNNNQLIMWMIAICFAFGIFMLFSSQLKFIGKILVRAVAGCTGFWTLNLLFTLAEIGVMVGVNPLTALTVGILGIPGFISLYVVQLIL